jgi:hypothetical protein
MIYKRCSHLAPFCIRDSFQPLLYTDLSQSLSVYIGAGSSTLLGCEALKQFWFVLYGPLPGNVRPHQDSSGELPLTCFQATIADQPGSEQSRLGRPGSEPYRLGRPGGEPSRLDRPGSEPSRLGAAKRQSPTCESLVTMSWYRISIEFDNQQLLAGTTVEAYSV